MKILVLSLLRLGDILQQAPLLRELRRSYPEACLDVIVNDSNLQAANILQEVDHWISFDRKKYQVMCREAETHLFTPVLEIEKWLKALGPYDLVFNWTHNRMSAIMAGAIKAKSKFGLREKFDRIEGLENPWSHYLDQVGPSGAKSHFHLNDIFAELSDLRIQPRSPRETKDSKLILLQPLTSDVKKNWSLSSWKKFLSAAQKKYPQYQWIVLCAPFELPLLSKYFNEEQVYSCDLKQAAQLLEQAKCLITGDTAIKHLAAIKQTPILEINLGSADGLKTSAYLQKTMIMRSTVECAPCSHVLPCHQPSQLCAEAITVDDVLDFFASYESNEPLANIRLGLECLTTEQDDWRGITYRSSRFEFNQNFEKQKKQLRKILNLKNDHGGQVGQQNNTLFADCL